MQLVHQYVLESALRYPKKCALVCDNREVTYSTLIANIHALGDVCVVEGLRKGDRVLIMLRDKVDFIVAAYAIIRAGGIGSTNNGKKFFRNRPTNREGLLAVCRDYESQRSDPLSAFAR